MVTSKGTRVMTLTEANKFIEPTVTAIMILPSEERIRTLCRKLFLAGMDKAWGGLRPECVEEVFNFGDI